MSYVGENAVGWLLLPAFLVAVCFGLGLLTERALRVRIVGALLAPLGLCVAIVVLMPLYKVGAPGFVAALVLVGLAVAGLVLGRSGLRERIADAPALAAAAFVYACYVAPVVLSGDWTWAGYNFVNDTAVQLLLAEYVSEHGANQIDFRMLPDGSQPLTTHDVFVREYLRTNYPLGAHELLGTLSTALRTDSAVLYQPFLATLGGIGAMALVALGRRSGMRPWVAAGTAAIAGIAGLLYQYSLQGNVKELAFFAIFAAAAALGRELLASTRPVALAVCLGIAGGAALSVYSAGALPYLGLLALVLIAARWFAPRPEGVRPFPLVQTTAAGVVAFGVASFIGLLGIVGFSDTASGLYAGDRDELGHLARPLPTIQGAGVWLSGNYREPIKDGGAELATNLASWSIIALLLAGAVWLLRRREVGPLLYFIPLAVTYAIFQPRVASYADAKMLVALSPAVLFLAIFGLMWLRRGIARVVGVAAGVGLGALVVATAALAYHDVQLAPTDRMRAIEELAERDITEPVLWNEFEEFAKYFGREVPINVSFENLTPRQVKLLEDQRFYGSHWDLDQQRVGFVQSFPWIVTRRAPDASRPPAGYERVYSNEYYDLWRRTGRPRARVHLPLGGINEPSATPDCDTVESFAGKARPGERLVAAERAPLARFDPSVEGADRPPGWPENGPNPGTVTSAIPGAARGTVELAGGRYEVWLRGSFGRPVIVRVDGREVGRGTRPDGPRQWTELREIELPPGRHRVDILRGGGTLAPGNGNGAYSLIGPVAFEPAGRDPARLREVDPRDARDLCGGSYDWLEIVRR